MKLGDLVTDYALEMSGIIVGSMWTEERERSDNIHWEWQVLYANGELRGADTSDLLVGRWWYNESR